jgi:hypothetical protein
MAILSKQTLLIGRISLFFGILAANNGLWGNNRFYFQENATTQSQKTWKKN